MSIINRLLDLIDLAFNYVGTQAALEPLVELPRLLTVLIYGNPVLGASGEDPTGVYVEELFDAAYAAREGYTQRVLDIVTEVPRKRTLRKGATMSNRHATYKEVSIVQVDNEMDSLRKTTRAFKQDARRTLFSQAVDIARTNKLPSAAAGAASLQDLEFDTTTFLTAASSTVSGKGVTRENEEADGVMAEVAREMQLMDLTDIRTLREKMMGGGLEKHEDTVLPMELFSRSMTKPSTLATYPLAMNTAIKSLRFAINHPLTNHDEVPSSSMFPPQHHVSHTTSSLNRQLPRRTANAADTEENCRLAALSHRGKTAAALSPGGKTGVDVKHTAVPGNKANQSSEFKSAMQRRRKSALRNPHGDQARASTLRQIEDVLDGLNRHAQEVSSRGGGQSGPDNVIVRGISRPNTGIKGLVDMVNAVMSELES